MEEYSYYDKPEKVKKEKSSKKKIISTCILVAVYAVLVASIIFLTVWGIGLSLGSKFAADLRKEFNDLIGAQYYSDVSIYVYLLLILNTGILVTILLVRDNLKKKKKKVTHRY